MQFDESFINKLKEQDHNAFNTFYLQTVDGFFRYISSNYFVNKEDAEDVIASFYVKWRDAVKNYDSKQSFSAYYWTIFKNTLKDYFKKNTDIPFSGINTDEDSPDFEDTLMSEDDIAEFLQSDFQFEQIQEAIQKLDEISKDIIHHRFIEEKSNEEIAIILWLTNDNVRQKISRAIKLLKNLLNTN